MIQVVARPEVAGKVPGFNSNFCLIFPSKSKALASFLLEKLGASGRGGGEENFKSCGVGFGGRATPKTPSEIQLVVTEREREERESRGRERIHQFLKSNFKKFMIVPLHFC